MAKAAQELVFREVIPERWQDMEKLFESRGGPKYCWCMVWRGGDVDRADRESRKAAMKSRVEANVPVGLLGFAGEEPVAWCSVAPRTTYRSLGGLDDPEEDPDGVWSVVCFFLKKEHRRKGALSRLIQAAVDHVRKRGGTVLEAYPVDPDSPSYRFMGFVSTFEEAGFRKVGRAGKRRHVMRLEL